MMGYAVRQDKDLLIYVGCPSEMMHKETCACNKKILATPLVSKSVSVVEPAPTESKVNADNSK
jgi:hypothetical protein